MGDDYLLQQRWVYNGLIEAEGREKGWENLSGYALSIMNTTQRTELGKAIANSELNNTSVIFDPFKYAGL